MELVSYDLLEKIEYWAKKILTEDFLRDLEKQMTTDTTGKKKAHIEQMESHYHPMRSWWQLFKRDKQLSLESGNMFYFCDDSALFAQLIFSLMKIKDSEGFKRLIPRLIDPVQFYSARFEAIVASNYCENGYKVIFNNEFGTSGEKVSDLYVFKTDTRDYIAVECKSMDDQFIRIHEAWQDFLEQVGTVIHRNRQCLDVKFEAWGIPPPQSLLDHLERLFKENRDSSKQTIDGVNIKISKISEWGSLIGSELYNGHFPERGSGASVIFQSEDRVFKNMSRLSFLVHESLDMQQRIVSALKKARKQLPKQVPGIIHIELPLEPKNKLLAVVDVVYDDIIKRLENDTTRANVLILNGVRWDRVSYMPLCEEYYFFGNNNASKRIPKWFFLINNGCLSSIKNILAEGGGFEIEICPEDSWAKESYFPILSFSTPDAKRQLMIWRLRDYRLRMDLVSPLFGRRVVYTEPIKVTPGIKKILTAKWDRVNAELLLVDEPS